MDGGEFEIDRHIDPAELDVEAVRQADIFFKWAERSVEARGRVDHLKFEADTKLASLEMAIRSNPTKYKLDKVTESAIASRARIDDEYVELYKELLDAKAESALLDQAVAAMEQRKRMLEILVTLHGQDYFAGPSVPRSLVDAWKEHQGRQTARVNDKQQAALRKRVRVKE